MRSSLHRRGIVLGLLIAVGGFAIDLYIPAFAAIARDLRTDPGRVQLTMTAYFLAVGVGQVVYGPISDAIGRRRPIFAGLAVFVAGSVWAARLAAYIAASDRAFSVSTLPPCVEAAGGSEHGDLAGRAVAASRRISGNVVGGEPSRRNR